MEFQTIKRIVEEQVGVMLASDEKLYSANIDKDKLWDIYLETIPGQENPIYRTNRVYDCSCCRNYIKNLGRIVQLNKVGEEFQVTTIFDGQTKDADWNKVLKEMSDYVKSCDISDIYLSSESAYGTNSNFELDKETQKTITYEHFRTEIPRQHLFVKTYTSGTLDTVLGNARTARKVFQRALEEITEDAIESVLDLSKQNSLYKGEEWIPALTEFLELKKKYMALNFGHQRDLFAWYHSVKSNRISHIRNSSMGTLLVDLSEGKPLDIAVKAYESIVAPANYKRPKAIFTEKMLEEAKKTIVELGYANSLSRRFAKLDDISVNDILFCNRDASKRIKGATDIFDKLKKEAKSSPKNFSKVEEIGIEDFIANVLPTATSVEAYVENKHQKNFCSLIAPTDKDSKTMFKWDNNFCWAYSGNMTDSALRDNVKSAGGRVDGVLRFSIQWNDVDRDKNDLDAHCIEPNGFHIYFGQKKSYNTQGELDVDIRHPGDAPAVENITYPVLYSMKNGLYRFYVHNYSHRGGRQGFRAEIEFNGQIYSYDYRKELRQDEEVPVAEVTLKDGNFTIKHLMESSASQKQIWNISTLSFVPVSVVCYSPNFWNGKKLGNKHYMFMLKDCVNPERPNGWYNEFLCEELESKHKHVMEALSSKAHVEDVADQLSGLGFSSTQRNELVVKVQSSIERLLKIKF